MADGTMGQASNTSGGSISCLSIHAVHQQPTRRAY